MSSSAAWNCEDCRKSGLVTARNCGRTTPQIPANNKIVWARGNAIARQCPKSIITAESLSFLEEHRAYREIGRGELLEMDARSVEAILILEREVEKENQVE